MALWNNTDTDASKPKYLSDDLKNDQSVSDKDATLGLSVNEAQNAGNIAKGLNTPGWVTYTTYTDGNGRTRNKSEVLVAMATITGDDDTVDPDPVITIDTQPINDSVTSPESADFVVEASITNGGVLTYQWEVSTDSGANWDEISGATSPALVVESGDDEYVTGNEFRVVVSGGAGATPVTSDEVTLTITE
jgi:hypothetical protein